MGHLDVTDLMNLPDTGGRADEIGPVDIDPDEMVYCPGCDREVAWGAPQEEHDHDFVREVEHYGSSEDDDE